ncbi:MAG: serine/threonine-protein kinase [Myxococcota bacterium]
MNVDSIPVPASEADESRTVLSDYTLDGAVAEGSMGRIYRAHHVRTGERVAVKMLHPDVAQDEVAVARFRREHQTAASLRHPHIVHVHEFGETEDGRFYIAMEYLEGRELGQLLADDGPLPPERLVPLICQLALGLSHAHDEGVIHRDLKPANVFVSDEGGRDFVRVVDFGSVKLQLDGHPKLTAFGLTLGSPFYMSPEQAMGVTDLDPRSDVFAFAAIVYELATGVVAFGASTTGEILKKVTSEEPAPVSTLNAAYPWAFDGVVQRAMRKEKSERFETATDFANALLESLGLVPDVPGYAERAPREVVRSQFDSIAGSSTASPRSAKEPSVMPLPTRETPWSIKLLVAAAVLGVVGAAALLFAA